MIKQSSCHNLRQAFLYITAFNSTIIIFLIDFDYKAKKTAIRIILDIGRYLNPASCWLHDLNAWVSIDFHRENTGKINDKLPDSK